MRMGWISSGRLRCRPASQWVRREGEGRGGREKKEEEAKRNEKNEESNCGISSMDAWVMMEGLR